MARTSAPLYSEDHIRQGGPSNATFQHSFSRHYASADNAIGATGVVHSTFCPIQPGDIINNITFCTGGTAATAPTAGFVAIYSSAGALLGQSADFGSTARAANTAYTIPLVTAITMASGPSSTSCVYIAISVTATVVPTIRGLTVGNAVMGGTLGITSPSTPRILAQTHGSAVGAVAPATIASPTTVATVNFYILT